MFTANGFRKKMEALLELSNHDDAVADILQEISNERGEVDSVIRSNASNYPEEGDLFDFVGTDREDWRRKYEDLKSKYNARFFRNADPGTTVIPDLSSPDVAEEGMEYTDRDIEEKEEKQIDDLFKREDK